MPSDIQSGSRRTRALLRIELLAEVLGIRPRVWVRFCGEGVGGVLQQDEAGDGVRVLGRFHP